MVKKDLWQRVQGIINTSLGMKAEFRSHLFMGRELPMIVLAGITVKSCAARGQMEAVLQQCRMWIKT